MKQIWKCDHCGFTSEDYDEMAEHESTCSFNPEIKSCDSCCHMLIKTCKFGLNINGDVINCEKWKNYYDGPRFKK